MRNQNEGCEFDKEYEHESYFNISIIFKHLGGRGCGINHDMTKKAVIDTVSESAL